VIQVCSRCGTRWNVRDRQRAWCPRCHGPLLAASDQPLAPPSGRPPASPASPQPRPGSGYRWIAVRPGPPPPPRRRPRPLGPTPRYRAVPRWGLSDPVVSPAVPEDETASKGASPNIVRAALLAASAIFALAAAAHVLRYLLLLINRTILLPPFVAIGALLLGVLVSLAAIVAVIVAAVAMTSWLIARRAAAFGCHGQDDPRPAWALWAGALTPVVNLVWGPVFVLELARVEQIQVRQRGPIFRWWMAWVFSTAISAWAIWTSSATTAQGVADNTIAMVIAYLAGLAVLLLLWRVFDGFVRKPVGRPSSRWVIVAVDPVQPAAPDRKGDTATSVQGSDDADDADDAAGESGESDRNMSIVGSRDREPAA